MSPKELCLALAETHSDKDVVELLKKAGYWDDASAWRTFNDDENNFSTIGNQSAEADGALVEKLINSVDAMLMSAYVESGDHERPGATPETMEKAVEKYFGVRHGRLAHMSTSERSKLAENIWLVSSGGKSNPCYSIIDRGEGQSPTEMPKTILAVSRKNKLRIPFVQGKFHMGGTGVIPFCGENHMQLIVSKRNPKMAEHETDPLKDEWGFTVIRRESHEGVRSSVYTYLAPKKEILHFRADSLPLLPGKYPEPRGEPMEHGMYIKLFEYALKGYKTNIILDAYYRISLLLPGIALPIRFAERRKGYTGHSFETSFAGLKVRLEEDKTNVLEENFPLSDEIQVKGHKMKVLVYAFKKDKSSNYRRGEGIVFTVNGQSHAFISDNFFSRKKVQMDYLSDSLLVLVDCSELTNRAREDLFMNSRDRLRGGDLQSCIIAELEEIIGNNPILKQLRMERRQNDLHEKLADAKPFEDLLTKALKFHPALAHLMQEGKRISNPFNLEATGVDEKYEGRQYPTYFRIKKPASQEVLMKHCPINKACRIQFETDVVNDYFGRDEFPGTSQLTLSGNTIDRSLNLSNGIASLNMHLPSDACEGEILEYELHVTDETQVEPFVNKFCIICDAPAEKGGGGNGERRDPPGDTEEGTREQPQKLNLPPIYEVEKEQWPKRGFGGFNEQSALDAVATGEGGYDFYVNIHNVFLLNEIKAQSKKDADILKAQFKYGLALVGMALIQDFLCKEKESEEKGVSMRRYIYDVTKAIAPMIIPIIDVLGEVEI